MFVAGEEEFDAFAVAGEGGGAVAFLDGAVEGLVGFEQRGGHRERVVEIGEAGARCIGRARFEVAEASVAEVPVVVYDYVPGQERGNLDYVRTNGIGVVALTTAEVVSSVARIVHNQERLGKMRSQQTAIAPRGSSRRIAELIGQIAISGRRPTIPAAG